MSMDEILILDTKRLGDAHELPPQPTADPRWSSLSFAVGRNGQPTDCPGMGVGFTTGFWEICGAFFFNRTWRHAFFRFADDIKGRMYVTTVIKMNWLSRKARVFFSK